MKTTLIPFLLLAIAPAVPAAGAPSVDGFLVFGIGTRDNNGLGSAKIIPVDGSGCG